MGGIKINSRRVKINGPIKFMMDDQSCCISSFGNNFEDQNSMKLIRDATYLLRHVTLPVVELISLFRTNLTMYNITC